MVGIKLVLCCLLATAAAGPPVVKNRQEILEFKETLERSREDDGLILEERMEMNPEGNVWGNSGKFEGDILLDDEQIEDLVNGYASGGRMAYVRAGRRWPQNTMVFEFVPNEHTVAQQREIRAAMDVISRQTCVRFRQRTASDRTFVRVTGRTAGCFAHVGFNPNRQHQLNLARNTVGRGCFNRVVIIHELMHNIGFWHMQSTYNRYTYVRIHWNNMQQGTQHNFQRYDQSIVSNLRLPYEYGSCMHYGTHFFSRNGQPTLTTTRQYSGTLGQTVRVTGWDISRIRRHYNCPGAWSAEALEEARTTVFEVDEDGVELIEKKVDNLPLADELEPIDDEQLDEDNE